MSPASSFPPSDEFELPTCAERGTDFTYHSWDPAPQLQLAQPGDYIAVLFFEECDLEATSSVGEPCADVVDVEACEAFFDEEVDLHCESELVVRRGDDLVIYSGADMTRALLPIDSGEEALVAAVATGDYYGPSCNAPEGSFNGVRQVAGGFEVVLTGRDVQCTPEGPRTQQRETFYRHLVFVGEDGTVEHRDREVDYVTYCEDECVCSGG